ncbi:MAG TPA: nicotinate phosphoribosyltransferase [Chthoniobacterales bacterium]|nr:nicotinate phosphoribosyltransferase [Chthoniobacterales bacterium]
MNKINPPAHRFSALTTDLYEVTMACGYWKAGVSDHEAAFHVVFRENPFGGEFTVACGLAQVVDLVSEFRFQEEQVYYLGLQRGNDGKPLFDPGFLGYLRRLRLTCDIDAVPEGTLVFPHEPLIRVCGPIIHCQLLETALLNILNFQSLIATKATRVSLAAGKDAVIEFGLRRAQGVDGGLSAARATYIGGCAGTSNLQAGQRFGIPVSGTQAHSWVMFFESEREAFETYAKWLPNNCVFLVDTYNSIDGVRRAIGVAKQLRKDGHEMIGVRLDSGDRVALSIESRRMLDQAGFPDAKIVCSGDLDEFAIAEMKRRGAKIDIWGVGTKLTTGFPDAALNGIYKLAAVRRPGEKWKYRFKLSDEPGKTSLLGLLQVRRYGDEHGNFVADAIYEIDHGVGEPCVIVDLETGARRTIQSVGEAAGFPRNDNAIPHGRAAEFTDLLVPVFRKGELVYQVPAIDGSRDHARKQLSSAPPEILKFKEARRYDVGLESSLHELRSTLIAAAKRRAK